MKRFVVRFCCFFCLLYFVLAYYYIIRAQFTGDLGRLGQIPFGNIEKYNVALDTNLVVNSYAIADSLQYDSIVVIGDSFSQFFDENGYVPFMANSLKVSVLNLKYVFWEIAPEQLFLTLLNSSRFKKNTIVIVESAERSIVNRLVNIKEEQIDLSLYISNNKVEWSINDKSLPFQPYYVASWMRMMMDFDNPVPVFDLIESKFSPSGFEDKLYVHMNDLNFQYTSDSLLYEAFNKLMWLRRKAKEQGIELMYVVAANKYDVYSDAIKDSKYLRDETLNVFSDIDTTWFVNTKTLLQPYVAYGVKDVYYVNDTHWSPVGAEIVGEYLAKLISKHYLEE